MHKISADAKAAADELRAAISGTSKFPKLAEFVLKLEYEFTAAFFHGDIWLKVNKKLGLPRCAMGHGHLLFFRMRGRFREMRDYAHYLQSPKKNDGPADEVPDGRHQRVLGFCDAIADTDVN